jgi:hypothetical protein
LTLLCQISRCSFVNCHAAFIEVRFLIKLSGIALSASMALCIRNTRACAQREAAQVWVIRTSAWRAKEVAAASFGFPFVRSLASRTRDEDSRRRRAKQATFSAAAACWSAEAGPSLCVSRRTDSTTSHPTKTRTDDRRTLSIESCTPTLIAHH